MQQTIFYSWQSDLPNSTNRGFIQDRIEEALEELKSTEALKIEPVLDRDTAGVAGSPDIGLTIFSKISKAAVFICDVSIVHSTEGGRSTPNPNVLIELGYALKTMGASRIIMVMNTSFGGPELLPFDLKQKRVLTYTLSGGDDKASAKKSLGARFIESIKTVLEETEETASKILFEDPTAVAIEAIKNKKPDASRAISAYMVWLSQELKKLDPHKLDGEPDENLVQALNKSVPLVKSFDSVSNAISAMEASAAARTLFKNFEYILRYYRPSVGFPGSSKNIDFDFFKFIGHELLVILIGYLIKDGRWGLLNELLQSKIHLENHPSGIPDTVSFTMLVSHVVLLDEVRNTRLQTNNQRRISMHADILKERHENMPLSENLTWHEFIDADYFLYFYSFANSRGEFNWWPRTWVYLNSRVPRFIMEATSPTGAKDLTTALGLQTTAELRPTIQRAIENYQKGIRNSDGGFLQDPFRGFDVNKISGAPTSVPI